jgi:4-amino-4-deoxy-L-arabinose transferase-like glycosyltransferase
VQNTGSTALRIAAVFLVVCAGYSAAGSLVLSALVITSRIDESSGFLLRTLVKAFVFSGLSLGGVWVLLRGRIQPSGDDSGESPMFQKGFLTLIFGALCLVVVVVFYFPNLSTNPSLLPDEAHHARVARNIAEYGQYASGHPDERMRMFDVYDSVGPAVLIPVAFAFKLFGSTVLAARSVIALSFVLLCLAAYRFARPIFGEAAAALGALGVATAWGSVYLARTLYGEGPALLFLILALLTWRHALQAPNRYVVGFIAGLCFALAVLSKTFIILALWGGVGAYLYDRATHRRIRWQHVAYPAMGFIAVMGLWSVAQRLHAGPQDSAAMSTLGLYKHYLMFGIATAPKGVLFLLVRAKMTVVMTVGLFAMTSLAFKKRYDPPMIMLTCTAVLLIFWWLFFTPATIQRYLWYTFAIGGLGLGPALVAAWAAYRSTSRPTAFRYSGLALLLVLVGCSSHLMYREAAWVFGNDSTADEYALAAHIGARSEGEAIATTHWPLVKSLDFLTGRAIEQLEAYQPGSPSTVVVWKDDSAPVLEKHAPDAIIGPYAVFHGEG